MLCEQSPIALETDGWGEKQQLKPVETTLVFKLDQTSVRLQMAKAKQNSLKSA